MLKILLRLTFYVGLGRESTCQPLGRGRRCGPPTGWSVPPGL